MKDPKEKAIRFMCALLPFRKNNNPCEKQCPSCEIVYKQEAKKYFSSGKK